MTDTLRSHPCDRNGQREGKKRLRQYSKGFNQRPSRLLSRATGADGQSHRDVHAESAQWPQKVIFLIPLVKSNRLSPNLISVIATCRERHGTKRSLMTLRATRRQRSYLVLIFSCSSRPKRRKQLRQERRSPQAPAVAVLGLLGQQSKAASDVCWSCSLPFPPQCNIIIVPSSFLRKHT